MLRCVFLVLTVVLTLVAPAAGQDTRVILQQNGTSLGGTRILNCTGSLGCSIVDGIGVLGGGAGAGGALLDPGGNGIIKRISLNTTAPAIAGTDFVLPSGSITGNAGTATAFAMNPTDCAVNEFPTSIDANGNLTCRALTDADIPNNITINLAATATALAANGTNATGGFAITGVDAQGNFEGAFDVITPAELSAYVPPTATALAADGTNAPAGQAIGGVDTQGNFQGAFDVATQTELDTHTALTTAHGATATPTASRIPLSGGTGELAGGWLPLPTAVTRGAVLASGNCDPTTGKQIGIGTNGLPVCGVDQNTGGGGGVTVGDKGDITVGPSVDQWAIDNDAITDTKVPNNITIDVAATATALVNDPQDCNPNQFPTAINTLGNLTCRSLVDADVPDTITVNLAAAATTATNLTGKTFAGTGTVVRLSSGTFLTDECVKVDTNGNFVTAGAACGTSSGGVTNGNKGDITVSTTTLPGDTWTINANAITDGKVANNITVDVATTALALASTPTGCGANQFAIAIAADGDLSCTALSDAMIPDDITLTNYQLAATKLTTLTNLVCSAGQVIEQSGGDYTCATDNAGVTDGNKVDIQVSLSGTDWQIKAGVVGNPELANMTAPSVKGRATAGTGAPEDLTMTQLIGIIPTFTASAPGLVPLSGGGTVNFLRADGTWTPAGGVSGVSSFNGRTGAVSPASNDYPSTLINITPVGTIAGPTLQEAIVEIEGEKPDKVTLSTVGTINLAGNPVDWSQLKNVPAGFADGTDNAGGGAGTLQDVVSNGRIVTSAVGLASAVEIGEATRRHLFYCTTTECIWGLNTTQDLVVRPADNMDWNMVDSTGASIINVDEATRVVTFGVPLGDASIADNITVNLAATASLLANDPADCGPNQFANAISTAGNLGCAALTNPDIPDDITVSNYLLLAGGTLTGQLVVDNLGIEFEETGGVPTCGSGNYTIYADTSTGTLKKCTNGTRSDLDTTGSGIITAPAILTAAVDGPAQLTIQTSVLQGSSDRFRFGTLAGDISKAAIYLGSSTATATNYAISGTDLITNVNGSVSLFLATAGIVRAHAETFGLTIAGALRFPYGTPSVAIRDASAGVMEINNLTQGQNAPLIVGLRDTGLTTLGTGLTIRRQTTGTPSGGFGSSILFQNNSSTTINQNAARIDTLWTDANDANRTAAMVYNLVYPVGGTPTMTEVGRWIPRGLQSAATEYVESTTNPSCGSTDYTIFANTTDAKLKKCQAGTITDLDTGGTGGTLQQAYDSSGTTPTITLGANGLRIADATSATKASILCGNTGCTITKKNYYSSAIGRWVEEFTPVQDVISTIPATLGYIVEKANGTDLFTISEGSGTITATSAAPVDFSGALSTKSCKAGTIRPPTCSSPECFIDTDEPTTARFFICTGTNTWTAQGGGGSAGDVTAATNFGIDNVLIRSDGTAKGVQGSGITIDDSNNLTTAGSITSGSGSAAAGVLTLGEGTAPAAAAADTIQLAAPTNVTTQYNLILPAAASTGFVKGTFSGGVQTLSFQSELVDGDINDTITANRYLLLTGGTMTGQIVTSNLGIEFTESDTNPGCSPNSYNIYADFDEQVLKKCENGATSVLGSGGTGPAGPLNTQAARAPLPTDDGPDGYSVFSRWSDTSVTPNKVYVAVDVSSGAAVWIPDSDTDLDQQSLQSAFNNGKTIFNANSLANAFKVGFDNGDGDCSDANEGCIAFYNDGPNGMRWDVFPPGNRNTDIPNGFAGVWRVDTGSGYVEAMRLDATTLKFNSTWRPKKSVEAMGREFSTCTFSEQVVGTGKNKVAVFTCADDDTGGFDFDFVMPDNWDAGTIQFKLSAYSVAAAPAGSMLMTCSAQAVSDGDTIPNKNITGEVNVSISFTGSAQYKEETTTSLPFTFSGVGTPSAGDHIYGHCDMDSSTNITGGTIADIRINATAKVYYTITQLTE